MIGERANHAESAGTRSRGRLSLRCVIGPLSEATRTLPPICPGVLPSDDRFGCVPNGSLWRWVARALGQVLACLAHRDARPAGGGADVGDRREQGVLPEVVGLPPGDLIEQVRFGPAMEGLLRPALRTGAWCLARRARCTRAGTARVVPPGAAGRPGWPCTSPARLRRGGGTPRRGRCYPAGAGAQARSLARRCQRRGRARRAGHAGRSRCPRGGRFLAGISRRYGRTTDRRAALPADARRRPVQRSAAACPPRCVFALGAA